MRCDRCGSDIAEGQEVETTRSELVGGLGPTGAYTQTESVTLCPRCARVRDWWARFAAVLLGVVVVAAIVIVVRELIGR